MSKKGHYIVLKNVFCKRKTSEILENGNRNQKHEDGNGKIPFHRIKTGQNRNVTADNRLQSDQCESGVTCEFCTCRGLGWSQTQTKTEKP